MKKVEDLVFPVLKKDGGIEVPGDADHVMYVWFVMIYYISLWVGQKMENLMILAIVQVVKR